MVRSVPMKAPTAKKVASTAMKVASKAMKIKSKAMKASNAMKVSSTAMKAASKAKSAMKVTKGSVVPRPTLPGTNRVQVAAQPVQLCGLNFQPPHDGAASGQPASTMRWSVVVYGPYGPRSSSNLISKSRRKRRLRGGRGATPGAGSSTADVTAATPQLPLPAIGGTPIPPPNTYEAERSTPGASHSWDPPGGVQSTSVAKSDYQLKAHKAKFDKARNGKKRVSVRTSSSSPSAAADSDDSSDAKLGERDANPHAGTIDVLVDMPCCRCRCCAWWQL